MIETLVGQKVVIDFNSSFVCLGKLHAFDDSFFELVDADLHDLRDTQTTRDSYVAASKRTGIRPNRKKLLIARREVVAIGRFKDVIEE